MTVEEIADELGCSVRTVQNAWRSGIRKVQRIPGAYEALLAAVRNRPPATVIRCGSVECNREYVRKFAIAKNGIYVLDSLGEK